MKYEPINGECRFADGSKVKYMPSFNVHKWHSYDPDHKAQLHMTFAAAVESLAGRGHGPKSAEQVAYEEANP